MVQLKRRDPAIFCTKISISVKKKENRNFGKPIYLRELNQFLFAIATKSFHHNHTLTSKFASLEQDS